jgi:hypothetical protein
VDLGEDAEQGFRTEERPAVQTRIRLTLIALLMGGVLLAAALVGTHHLTATAAGGTGASSTGTTAAALAAAGTGAGATGSTLDDPVYTGAMRSWMDAYLFGLDTSALPIDDPANASDAQLVAAGRLVDDVQAGMAKLKTIAAPHEVSAVHEEFVVAMEQMTQAIEKYVNAVKTRNRQSVDAVLPVLAAAQARMQAAVQRLAPLVGETIPAAPAESGE